MTRSNSTPRSPRRSRASGGRYAAAAQDERGLRAEPDYLIGEEFRHRLSHCAETFCTGDESGAAPDPAADGGVFGALRSGADAVTWGAVDADGEGCGCTRVGCCACVGCCAGGCAVSEVDAGAAVCGCGGGGSCAPGPKGTAFRCRMAHLLGCRTGVSSKMRLAPLRGT